MAEQKAMFILSVLKNIINVYFDTFFVFYFFKVANYEVIPLAKYYIILYSSIGLGFFLIRNAMKKNIKVPYFRIGISLQALYIAMIMLLKENIINHILFVGIIKGIADGFYHFPKNILNSEKITNESRQKYDGLLNIVNKIFSIIIPICLGILLTFISYVNLGKIFFILFVVMFIFSFWVDDEFHFDKKFELKKFIILLKQNKNIRNSLAAPLLSGFTYSDGVMGVIITLLKINNFKTNLNLGFVDSICALISLLVCILFTIKIKNNKFKKILNISGIVSFLILISLAIFPNIATLILYLFLRNSGIKIIELIVDNSVTNLTNCNEIKKEFKAEYYCARDLIFSISRTTGYIILLGVCLIFGMEYINYILIFSAFAILLETIIIGKLNAKIN